MNLEKIKLASICDKIILFSLYATVFFLPISKAIIEAFSIIAIVCCVVKKIIQRQSVPETQLNLAIFAYLIICFFSISISSNLRISARTFFAKTLQDIALFFVLVDTVNSERRIKNFIYILFFSATLLGIDGIYQYFTHNDFIRHRPEIFPNRIYATFPTPNGFGCYLVTVIPFVLACFIAKFRFKLIRFLLMSLFILLFVCIMLTVSRGAWLAFAVSMLFMSLWNYRLGLFFLMVSLFVIATHYFFPFMFKSFINNILKFIAGGVDVDRQIIWQAAWKMFLVRPWSGLGLGTFMFNFSKFVAAGYSYGAPYAHNCYLQIASEIGIIGLLSFLSILIAFFYQGIKVLRSTQKTFLEYVLVASLAAILGYCTQMVGETILYSLDLGMLFWLILGLGAATLSNIQKSSSS